MCSALGLSNHIPLVWICVNNSRRLPFPMSCFKFYLSTVPGPCLYSEELLEVTRTWEFNGSLLSLKRWQDMKEMLWNWNSEWRLDFKRKDRTEDMDLQWVENGKVDETAEERTEQKCGEDEGRGWVSKTKNKTLKGISKISYKSRAQPIFSFWRLDEDERERET